MDFLRLLEKIRNPFFDFFFSLITRIGEETVFLVIAILIFWCINKREGYYVLMNIESKPELPAELDRVFKITEGIMRSLITVVEE